MAHEFHLPDIGEGLTEVTVLRWLVAVGDEVTMDEPLVEVDTDKAVMEIPAPHGGVLLHQGADAGEVLEVGSLLAVVGEPGETWEPVDRDERGATAPGSGSGAGPRTEAAPIVGTLDEGGDGAAARALPRVRRLAADLGIDLETLTGTGAGGRITEEDVRAAGGDARPVERRPLSPTRRAIAENLSRSWREIPHVTTYGEAAAAGLLMERRRLSDGTGEPVPLEALVIAAVTPLLAEYPEFNASFTGEAVVLKRHYDVGFAVDTPEGLMVAVVRDSDTRDVPGLAAEIRDLSRAARDRSIEASALRGQSFTVSNIGAVGGGYGTPIIPYGTTAILSIGRADPRPVVRDGVIVVAAEFPLSLSYDHRVIDGALGRRFLGAVIEALEGAGVAG